MADSKPSCAVSGCGKRVHTRGWCSAHYDRWRRNGDLGSVETSRPAKLPCAVLDCTRLATSRGWCPLHYDRWRRRGDPCADSVPRVQGPRRQRPFAKCSVETCGDIAQVRGWCGKHYKQWRKTGDPLPKPRRPGGVGMPGGTCSITGCEEPYHCRTWCGSHYGRWLRNGDPLAGKRSPRAVNPIITNRDADDGHKLCLRCDGVKPHSEFSKDSCQPDGICCYCKACLRDYEAETRAKDPERYQELSRRRSYRHVLKKYGMTWDDYDAMFVAQGGVCKICKNPETAVTQAGAVKVMAVDHDHVTLRVRGLLCAACNQGLGAFKDDIGVLASAIEYLTAAAP